MRVAVIGAGAIGGFLAGALARAGVEVGVVARGEHLAAIQRDGLQVRSDLGNFRVRLDAASDLRELGGFDVLLLTFKAHQWGPLLEQLEAAAAGGATAVTLQNGVPFWYVRKPPLHSVDPDGRAGRAFTDARTIGAVVHVSGNVERAGAVVQSGGLRYVLGDPRGSPSGALDALIETFRFAGLKPEEDRDVRATVWLKLVNNVGLNSVSALRSMTVRSLLNDRTARGEVRELMVETLNVGRAMGVVAEADVDARIEYAARLDDVKTSMLQDLERGRPLELDPIQGAAIELAARYGVPVPRLEAAYAALRRLEREGAPHG
ncbi:MAG TPA: 2-dehydropantoate 2-reductase [Candidatus Tumulicola sp.]|nr:2-dehydropantoate 2-reductase [Candidatus Tumulicola sp.]